MPTLFIFLFKVNIALLLFCAGYYLVLRHLTFYSLNRAYLVTAIVFATLYPTIDLSNFAQKHETLTKPVQNVVLIWKAPAQKLVTRTDYWRWAEVVFWAGAALLGFRLLVQLFSLFKLYRNSTPANILDHEVRLMEGDAAPFSFWQSIYVNPANHTPADLKAILLHEQVHVNGWHTIDILLAELSSIFYWFNPGIWLIKKAVRENIEFITDRKILNRGFDSKTYQYSLVNVSFNNSNPGIVNHFNISTIKKRIIMMNAKRSSRVNLTRYAFVVPAVVALLLVFTLTKAEVTRPLSLKIANAVKPITLAIRKAVTPVKKDTVLKTTPKLATKTGKPASISIHTDTVSLSFSYNRPDTGKKAVILFRNNNNVNSPDSLNFVVNGKKVSPDEFNKIDPNEISAVNVVRYDNLDGLLGPDHEFHFDNKRSIIFITTNDSEEGKKLTDKLSAHRDINTIRYNHKIPGLKGKVDNIVVTGYGNFEGSASTVDPVKLNNVTIVAGKPLALRTEKLTIVNGKPLIYNKGLKPATITGTAVYNDVMVRKGVKTKGTGDTIYLNGTTTYNTTGTKTLTLNGNGVYAAPGKFVDISSIRYDVTNVNRISDKLIVIDGKEASEKEMKKLSAFDIDRMSVNSDADTIKKYGDKAKYGVVYIYTKKSK